MKMIKFSIIVPVYNVENYLVDCIESILKQSFNAYEILLIDDGSTDSSGQICDKYASKYSMINTIHKKNGGLSDARNCGMKESKGEYIVFVDSDDYIEPETLFNFNRQLETFDNPDVLITRIKRVFLGTKKIKNMDEDLPIDSLNYSLKKDIIKWMFCKSNNLWPSVRYIVKKSIIEANGLKFAVGFLHEDLDWTSKLFLNVDTFAALDYYWYNHRIGREDSITTNNSNSKKTLDVIELVSSNIKDDKYKELDYKTRRIMYQRMVASLFSSLSNYKYFDDIGKKKVVNALSNNKHVFRYAKKTSHKLFIVFSKIFGYKMGLQIMKFI